MLVIGIVGGVGSGKSLVARQFEQLGAEVMDADRAGHEVLVEPEVEQAVRRRWGDGVFGADGRIDRAALARLLFRTTPGGREQLAYLEQLTHPRIERRLRARIAELARCGDVRVAVLDAAVMCKAGWDILCDRIVFVEAPTAQRRARAFRRGWSDEDFAARQAAQESLGRKQRLADWIIDNSGSPDRTLAQVQRVWSALDPLASDNSTKDAPA